MMVTDYNCEYLGLSRLCLMESAGKSLAEEVGKIAVYTFAKPVKVVIFTGSGGNGGDGFVAARYLLNRGYDVDIYMLKENIRSDDAKTNLEILENMKPRLSRLNIYNLKTLEDINSCEVAQSKDSEFVIVDGLLGTGIHGKLQTNIKRAIEIINESNGITISVDVPSGMDPLTGEINDNTSSSIISQLLYLDSINNDDISLYINSPGGSVSSGMAIYDTMNFIKSDVSTICIGMAASMGAFLLSSGEKGKRYALPNSEIMIHQPLGGVEGQATEIKIVAEHILKLKDKLNKVLSKNTGQSLDKIELDTDRDFYMGSSDALEYGLIDKIIEKKN